MRQLFGGSPSNIVILGLEPFWEFLQEIFHWEKGD